MEEPLATNSTGNFGQNNDAVAILIFVQVSFFVIFFIAACSGKAGQHDRKEQDMKDAKREVERNLYYEECALENKKRIQKQHEFELREAARLEALRVERIEEIKAAVLEALRDTPPVYIES